MFVSECQWVPSHLTGVTRFSVSKAFLFPWAEQAKYSGVSQTCAAACATENFILVYSACISARVIVYFIKATVVLALHKLMPGSFLGFGNISHSLSNPNKSYCTTSGIKDLLLLLFSFYFFLLIYSFVQIWTPFILN